MSEYDATAHREHPVSSYGVSNYGVSSYGAAPGHVPVGTPAPAERRRPHRRAVRILFIIGAVLLLVGAAAAGIGVQRLWATVHDLNSDHASAGSPRTYTFEPGVEYAPWYLDTGEAVECEISGDFTTNPGTNGNVGWGGQQWVFDQTITTDTRGQHELTCTGDSIAAVRPVHLGRAFSYVLLSLLAPPGLVFIVAAIIVHFVTRSRSETAAPAPTTASPAAMPAGPSTVRPGPGVEPTGTHEMWGNPTSGGATSAPPTFPNEGTDAPRT